MDDMSDIEKIKLIKIGYNLHGNVKVTLKKIDGVEYCQIGMFEVSYPLILQRELKLESLGIL